MVLAFEWRKYRMSHILSRETAVYNMLNLMVGAAILLLH